MKPPSLREYEVWDATATRPLTSPMIGEATASRRARDAELSRLMDGHEREKIERVTIRSPWTGRLYVVKR